MQTIISHFHPDFDSIAATWLLKRFFPPLHEATCVMVNTGHPDEGLLANADAVVDTGKVFDPDRLRFDHHHLDGEEANGTSATWQVFQFLLAHGYPVSHLGQLAALIMAGDTGKPDYGADWSRVNGIHALLSGFWRTLDKNHDDETNDQRVMLYGFEILDTLNLSLKARQDAAANLRDHVVYTSKDDLLWAIKEGGEGATFAAFEAGARLVVFQGNGDGDSSQTIGIMRGGEWTHPNVGELVGAVVDVLEEGDLTLTMDDAALLRELVSWFRHPAGFFTGRGTRKAPDPRPITISLVELAELIDNIWTR
jgi:hypothetical protein